MIRALTYISRAFVGLYFLVLSFGLAWAQTPVEPIISIPDIEPILEMTDIGGSEQNIIPGNDFINTELSLPKNITRLIQILEADVEKPDYSELSSKNDWRRYLKGGISRSFGIAERRRLATAAAYEMARYQVFLPENPNDDDYVSAVLAKRGVDGLLLITRSVARFCIEDEIDQISSVTEDTEEVSNSASAVYADCEPRSNGSKGDDAASLIGAIDSWHSSLEARAFFDKVSGEFCFKSTDNTLTALGRQQYCEAVQKFDPKNIDNLDFSNLHQVGKHVQEAIDLWAISLFRADSARTEQLFKKLSEKFKKNQYWKELKENIDQHSDVFDVLDNMILEDDEYFQKCVNLDFCATNVLIVLTEMQKVNFFNLRRIVLDLTPENLPSDCGSRQKIELSKKCIRDFAELFANQFMESVQVDSFTDLTLDSLFSKGGLKVFGEPYTLGLCKSFAVRDMESSPIKAGEEANYKIWMKEFRSHIEKCIEKGPTDSSIDYVLGLKILPLFDNLRTEFEDLKLHEYGESRGLEFSESAKGIIENVRSDVGNIETNIFKILNQRSIGGRVDIGSFDGKEVGFKWGCPVDKDGWGKARISDTFDSICFLFDYDEKAIRLGVDLVFRNLEEGTERDPYVILGRSSLLLPVKDLEDALLRVNDVSSFEVNNASFRAFLKYYFKEKISDGFPEIYSIFSDRIKVRYEKNSLLVNFEETDSSKEICLPIGSNGCVGHDKNFGDSETLRTVGKALYKELIEDQLEIVLTSQISKIEAAVVERLKTEFPNLENFHSEFELLIDELVEKNQVYFDGSRVEFKVPIQKITGFDRIGGVVALTMIKNNENGVWKTNVALRDIDYSKAFEFFCLKLPFVTCLEPLQNNVSQKWRTVNLALSGAEAQGASSVELGTIEWTDRSIDFKESKTLKQNTIELANGVLLNQNSPLTIREIRGDFETGYCEPGQAIVIKNIDLSVSILSSDLQGLDATLCKLQTGIPGVLFRLDSRNSNLSAIGLDLDLPVFPNGFVVSEGALIPVFDEDAYKILGNTVRDRLDAKFNILERDLKESLIRKLKSVGLDSKVFEFLLTNMPRGKLNIQQGKSFVEKIHLFNFEVDQCRASIEANFYDQCNISISMNSRFPACIDKPVVVFTARREENSLKIPLDQDNVRECLGQFLNGKLQNGLNSSYTSDFTIYSTSESEINLEKKYIKIGFGVRNPNNPLFTGGGSNDFESFLQIHFDGTFEIDTNLETNIKSRLKGAVEDQLKSEINKAFNSLYNSEEFVVRQCQNNGVVKYSYLLKNGCLEMGFEIDGVFNSEKLWIEGVTLDLERVKRGIFDRKLDLDEIRKSLNFTNAKPDKATRNRLIDELRASLEGLGLDTARQEQITSTFENIDVFFDCNSPLPVNAYVTLSCHRNKNLYRIFGDYKIDLANSSAVQKAWNGLPFETTSLPPILASVGVELRVDIASNDFDPNFIVGDPELELDLAHFINNSLKEFGRKDYSIGADNGGSIGVQFEKSYVQTESIYIPVELDFGYGIKSKSNLVWNDVPNGSFELDLDWKETLNKGMETLILDEIGFPNDIAFITLSDPELLPDFSGLRVQVGVNMDELGLGDEFFSVEGPDVVISRKGIRFAGARGVKIMANSELAIPAGPILISGFRGELLDNRLSFGANASLPPEGTSRLLRFEGDFNVDLENPKIFKRTGNLKLLSLFTLASSESELNLEKFAFKESVNTGAAFSDILDFQGTICIQARKTNFCGEDFGKERKLGGNLFLSIFKADIAEAEVEIAPVSNDVRIAADAKFDIVVFEGGVNLDGKLGQINRANVEGRGEANVGGFKLASIGLNFNRDYARQMFSIFGIKLGITVPNVTSLNKDTILDLIKALLSPDLENLDEGLKQLLAGNFNINPMGDFGPDNGGIYGDGGEGDTTPGATGAQGSSGGYESLNAATAASVSESKADTGESGEAVDGQVQGDGVAGTNKVQLSEVGEWYVYSCNSKDQQVEINANTVDGSGLQRVTYAPYETADWVHFRQAQVQNCAGPGAQSTGIPLDFSRSHYAHIVNQKLNVDGAQTDGAVYLFTELAGKSLYGRFASKQLDLSLDQHGNLNEVGSSKARVLRLFFSDAASVLRHTRHANGQPFINEVKHLELAPNGQKYDAIFATYKSLTDMGVLYAHMKTAASPKSPANNIEFTIPIFGTNLLQDREIVKSPDVVLNQILSLATKSKEKPVVYIRNIAGELIISVDEIIYSCDSSEAKECKPIYEFDNFGGRRSIPVWLKDRLKETEEVFELTNAEIERIAKQPRPNRDPPQEGALKTATASGGNCSGKITLSGNKDIYEFDCPNDLDDQTFNLNPVLGYKRVSQSERDVIEISNNYLAAVLPTEASSSFSSCISGKAVLWHKNGSVLSTELGLPQEFCDGHSMIGDAFNAGSLGGKAFVQLFRLFEIVASEEPELQLEFQISNSGKNGKVNWLHLKSENVSSDFLVYAGNNRQGVLRLHEIGNVAPKKLAVWANEHADNFLQSVYAFNDDNLNKAAVLTNTSLFSNKIKDPSGKSSFYEYAMFDKNVESISSSGKQLILGLWKRPVKHNRNQPIVAQLSYVNGVDYLTAFENRSDDTANDILYSANTLPPDFPTVSLEQKGVNDGYFPVAGSRFSGSISTNQRISKLRFKGEIGNTYEINVRGRGEQNRLLDPVLYVSSSADTSSPNECDEKFDRIPFSENGEAVLNCNDDTGHGYESGLTIKLESTQTVFIYVFAYDENAVGDFDVVVSNAAVASDIRVHDRQDVYKAVEIQEPTLLLSQSRLASISSDNNEIFAMGDNVWFARDKASNIFRYYNQSMFENDDFQKVNNISGIPDQLLNDSLKSINTEILKTGNLDVIKKASSINIGGLSCGTNDRFFIQYNSGRSELLYKTTKTVNSVSVSADISIDDQNDMKFLCDSLNFLDVRIEDVENIDLMKSSSNYILTYPENQSPHGLASVDFKVMLWQPRNGRTFCDLGVGKASGFRSLFVAGLVDMSEIKCQGPNNKFQSFEFYSKEDRKFLTVFNTGSDLQARTMPLSFPVEIYSKIRVANIDQYAGNVETLIEELINTNVCPLSENATICELRYIKRSKNINLNGDSNNGANSQLEGVFVLANQPKPTNFESVCPEGDEVTSFAAALYDRKFVGFSRNDNPVWMCQSALQNQALFENFLKNHNSHLVKNKKLVGLKYEKQDVQSTSEFILTRYSDPNETLDFILDVESSKPLRLKKFENEKIRELALVDSSVSKISTSLKKCKIDKGISDTIFSDSGLEIITNNRSICYGFEGSMTIQDDLDSNYSVSSLARVLNAAHIKGNGELKGRLDLNYGSHLGFVYEPMTDGSRKSLVLEMLQPNLSAEIISLNIYTSDINQNKNEIVEVTKSALQQGIYLPADDEEGIKTVNLTFIGTNDTRKGFGQVGMPKNETAKFRSLSAPVTLEYVLPIDFSSRLNILNVLKDRTGEASRIKGQSLNGWWVNAVKNETGESTQFVIKDDSSRETKVDCWEDCSSLINQGSLAIFDRVLSSVSDIHLIEENDTFKGLLISDQLINSSSEIAYCGVNFGETKDDFLNANFGKKLIADMVDKAINRSAKLGMESDGVWGLDFGNCENQSDGGRFLMLQDGLTNEVGVVQPEAFEDLGKEIFESCLLAKEICSSDATLSLRSGLDETQIFDVRKNDSEINVIKATGVDRSWIKIHSDPGHNIYSVKVIDDLLNNIWTKRCIGSTAWLAVKDTKQVAYSDCSELPSLNFMGYVSGNEVSKTHKFSSTIDPNVEANSDLMKESWFELNDGAKNIRLNKLGLLFEFNQILKAFSWDGSTFEQSAEIKLSGSSSREFDPIILDERTISSGPIEGLMNASGDLLAIQQNTQSSKVIKVLDVDGYKANITSNWVGSVRSLDEIRAKLMFEALASAKLLNAARGQMHFTNEEYICTDRSTWIRLGSEEKEGLSLEWSDNVTAEGLILSGIVGATNNTASLTWRVGDLKPDNCYLGEIINSIAANDNSSPPVIKINKHDPQYGTYFSVEEQEYIMFAHRNNPIKDFAKCEPKHSLRVISGEETPFVANLVDEIIFSDHLENCGDKTSDACLTRYRKKVYSSWCKTRGFRCERNTRNALDCTR